MSLKMMTNPPKTNQTEMTYLPQLKKDVPEHEKAIIRQLANKMTEIVRSLGYTELFRLRHPNGQMIGKNDFLILPAGNDFKIYRCNSKGEITNTDEIAVVKLTKK